MSQIIKITSKFTSGMEVTIKQLTNATDYALKSMAFRMQTLAKRPPPKGSPVAGVRVPEWSWVKKTKKKKKGAHNRDSIKIEKADHLKYVVRTETGYGGFLELGTSKMPARPYLAPAFKEAKAEFISDLKEGIKAV